MHVTIKKFPNISTRQLGILSTFTNMAKILQVDLTHVGNTLTLGQISNEIKYKKSKLSLKLLNDDY